MSSEDQYLNNRRGIGSRVGSSIVGPMTMVAGAAVAVTQDIPKSSWLSSVRFETATAFTGSPTNINARIGNASTGQQVVADVDVKAQGHITATIVAAYDSIGNNDGTLYLALAASGGTSPAGTVNAVIAYHAPTL